MSVIDSVGDVAYEAAPPTFFTFHDEPMLPGFERIAQVADGEVENVLLADWFMSPEAQLDGEALDDVVVEVLS